MLKEGIQNETALLIDQAVTINTIFTFSVCVNVRRGYDGRSLKLDMINLNSSSSWFHSDELEDQDGTQTVIPRHELMNIVSVTQLEKDTILVAYDSKYQVMGWAKPITIKKHQYLYNQSFRQ